MLTVEISADQGSLHHILNGLAAEEDGEHLRRDLAHKLREAAGPAAASARQSILAMHSGGLPHQGESLRAAVAASVNVSARLSGGAGAGVSIRARRRSVRGFDNAPRRLNNPAGWRHPVFGNRDAWVAQIGKPGWFDEPIRAHRDDFHDAVLQAMQDMAQRIAR